MIVSEDIKQQVHNHCTSLAKRIISCLENCENTQDMGVESLSFDVDVTVNPSQKIAAVNVVFEVK